MRNSNKLICVGLVVLALLKFGPHDGAMPNPAGPIAGKGLRVLFVAETKELSKYPPDQALILSAGDIRDYLDEHCAKEKSGQAAWRVFDPDQNMANEAKFWQDAMRIPHSPTPWVLVSNGRKGVSRQLPANIPAMKTLLEQYK